MYSDHTIVNVLSALLPEYGVRDVVICPGSRNVPLIHDLQANARLTCHPVTDERSAAYYALGIADVTGHPVAICITSGTAILNTLPAVAEAYYRQKRLILLSADRPLEFIDQLDGQTIPQVGRLKPFVRHTVTLPEGKTPEDIRYATRLIHEALSAMTHPYFGPVHINIPLGEPLFGFSHTELPDVHPIYLLHEVKESLNQELKKQILSSDSLMFVFGQMPKGTIHDKDIVALSRHAVVISEPLSAVESQTPFVEEAITCLNEEKSHAPETVIYVGGILVSKSLKQYLRKSPHTKVFMIHTDERFKDPLMHLVAAVPCKNIGEIISQIAIALQENPTAEFRPMAENRKRYVMKWSVLAQQIRLHKTQYTPSYSAMSVIKSFHAKIKRQSASFYLHYANSLAVRWACLYSDHYVFCNRGTNGIEGSISTAAGMSLVTDSDVYCLTGDLSFFYDQNALWNQGIRGNLKIILINNRGGAIFYKFDALKTLPERTDLIAAEHPTGAQGVCRQNNVKYLCVEQENELEQALDEIIAYRENRPILLEIKTQPQSDIDALRDYMSYIRNIIHKQVL